MLAEAKVAAPKTRTRFRSALNKTIAQRASRTPKIRRVLVHGLVYFGKMFADLMNGPGWQFRYYPDNGIGNYASMARNLQSCDLVYQIGGRVSLGKFLCAARILKKQRLVMHWVGSDTLDQRFELAQGKANSWVMHRIHHWAESEWMVREVEALGLPCARVPLPSSEVPDQPSPLPHEFSVLVYMPDLSRSDLYGLDRILQVARELPHIPFELVGLLRGEIANAPANLKVHRRIPKLAEHYRRASVVWRPVRHDGLSFMVLEALGHGRHVLWSYAFPGCRQVTEAADARNEIIRLYALHTARRLRINEDGARAIAVRGYLPNDLKKNILGRLQQILDS
jgi:hypothetical protein